MSNTKDITDKGVQMNNKKMDDLQAQLDIAVFEQEEMDVDKVMAILTEMEDATPETEKKIPNKEQLWKKIEEQSREEFAADKMLKSDKSKAGRSARIRRIVLTAATIVIAMFVGANIGTYATDKKNVFEYVSDLRNGTSFWITGDAPSMELDEKIEVYYSWNDVPNEYKEFLIIPQGLPEDMELYDIRILVRDIYSKITVRYLDDEAKDDFYIQIVNYQNTDFSFANYLYEERFEICEQKEVLGIELYYLIDENEDVTVQYMHGDNIYTLGGTIVQELMYDIAEKTIEFNFKKTGE